MLHPHRLTRLTLACCLLAALSLVACGDDSSEDTPAQTSTNNASTGTNNSTTSTNNSTTSTNNSTTATNNSTTATNNATTGTTGTNNGTTTPAEGLIISGDDTHPEGMAYDAEHGVFWFGSLSQGTINTIDWEGAEETIFTPDEAGWTTLGMKLMPGGDTLVVCAIFGVSTPEARSEIWAFDTDAKTRTAAISLEEAFGGTNCNDVVGDADGFVYVTDRESANLYRVSLADQTAEVFLDGPLLEPGVIGSNGIELTDTGLLLVGKYNPPELLRVPLDDPSAASTITLSGDALPFIPDGFDGIVFDGDTLTIAANSKVYRATSDDDWANATLSVHTPPESIAAVTVADGQVYGLKGEVVAFVLGLPVNLPFGIYPLGGFAE